MFFIGSCMNDPDTPERLAMKAEIIAIGSELLTPDRTDTNSLYLTEKLNETGFEVHLKTIVGDHAGDIEAILRAALQRSRLVLICGGLGPTEDDLTRTATASALGRSLEIRQDVLEALRFRFALRKYPMAKINERQAAVIEGAEVLANPVGTAPGMWIEEGSARIALLPGPPRELQAMFESGVMPRVINMSMGRRLVTRSFGLQGLAESEVDTRVAPIYTGYPAIQTTILAGGGCISIRLHQWLIKGESPAQLDELAAAIQTEMGDFVYTTSGAGLEEVVGSMLCQSGRTLAIAESCTSGMIGATLTKVPGSSDYFLGGILCYSNDLKIRLCGVPPELLEQCGAVSAEVAESLAQGVRRTAGSAIGLAVTGIAGPGGGSEQKPVGLVYFGIADQDRCIHARRIFPGDRDTVRELATTYAIGLLRRFLLPREASA
jgi:nicotinamide-nucleotide amidase